MNAVTTASTSRARMRLCLVLLSLLAPALSHGQLLDSWRANDMNLFDNGDAIGSWSSSGNRTALSVGGAQPILVKDATPGGSSVLRFNRNWMTVTNSPVAGLKSFSIALLFKASAAGTNTSSSWFGKSGIIDADEPGTTNDWGVVLDERGRLALGTGQPDATTTITGASLVDSNYHSAVLTWGAGAQAVYLDDRAVTRRPSGVSTQARNAAGFSIGSIHTSDGAPGRRFVGDIAEIRFYGSALTPDAATNVLNELKIAHIQPNLPLIRLFKASTNSIYLGESLALHWKVDNQTGLGISPDVGVIAGPAGSVNVSPKTTTTYVLTATNDIGVRSSTLTVFVDPGIPTANPQAVVTIRNTPRSVVLSGSDPRDEPLTFVLKTPPAHGVLSGTPPTLLYQPAADYFGSDAFTFVANDGVQDSPPATVSIRIDPLPTAPTRIVLSTTNLVYPSAAHAFVAGARTVDANPLDTHSYALVDGDGSRDNALFSLVNNGIYSQAPIVPPVPSDLRIRLRTTDSAGLAYEQAFVFRLAPDSSHVLINEIHYNGADNTVREEFVELLNPKQTALDLSGWRLQGGLDYVFPPGTVIAPGSFLVIAQDPPTLEAVYGVQALGPWLGALNNDGDDIALRDSRGVVVDKVSYNDEFPWPVAANGNGGSLELMNPALDNTLGSSWNTSLSPARPSPGKTNYTFTLNPPPQQRSIAHLPKSPNSTNTVKVTAKVTDLEGVESVVLEYQAVAAGAYVPSYLPLSIAELNANPFKTPARNPAYEALWVAVPMVDTGLQGDDEAGDDVYTAVLPAQANRTLVRYRIRATDTFGVSRRAPFEDDASLNFAYFVYDGIPDYFETPKAALETLPVYFLITRAKDILDCNGYDGLPQIDQFSGSVANEARYVFNWPAAIVYDGEVYDNIRYRLRGANGRYQHGKRNMRFKFNDGHQFQARDQTGKKYPTKWSSLTTGKGSSNRETLTFALNEMLNYRLWNLAGVPSPLAHYFHFRVITGAAEAPDAYSGDFWGLSWAQESYDVRFLQTHELEKGNLYKLINAPRSDDARTDQARQERYQAPFAVTNAGDALNIQLNLNGKQNSAWLLSYVNYSNWYRFHAIAEGIRHYDYWPDANKNAAWYFEPIYTPDNKFLGRLWTLPWDTDSTWGPTWNSGFDGPYDGIFAVNGGTQKPEMILDYKNTVREVRDLMFQPDQLMPLIDSFASLIRPIVVADLRRWSNAPSASNPKITSEAAYKSLSDAGVGLFLGLSGYVQDLKRFAFSGGSWPGGDVGPGGQAAYLDVVGADAAIPNRPSLTYLGAPGHPLDKLIFKSSPFNDPQGANTFASMRWRVAEVRSTNAPVVPPQDLPLEWVAVWESGELTEFRETIQIPGAYLKPGHTYRVRVSHKDTTGRWSRWSEPSEFIPTPVDLVGSIPESLVISEIMYHPSAPGEANEDAYEFLEFKNVGPSALDLSGVHTTGITYTFTNGTVLAAGATWLIVKDPVAFARRYPGIAFNGVYQGKLSNGGDTVSWIHPQGVILGELTYSDQAPWPVTPDGFGFSLVLDDPVRRSYRASTRPGGSPGADDPPSTVPPIVISELLTSPPAGLGDAIEVYNPNPVAVDVSGWWLTDDPALPKKFRIPPGSILAPSGYLYWTETQFNTLPGTETSFALSSLGDNAYLFSADASGALTGYSHGWNFGGAPQGVSLGRYVNSAGEESLALQNATSLGQTNGPGPWVGTLVISEIHYHPRLPEVEFVEIYNRGDIAVDLFDPGSPTNRWKIQGLGFTFPAGQSLAAHQHLLVVSTDPQQYRLRHGIPERIQIYGPYTGSLQGNGETLKLQAPDRPTASGTPYYDVDQVRYRDQAPWPTAADGSGASLQRTDPDAYGNEPGVWTAAIPSPGAAWTQGPAPILTRSPLDQVLIAGRDGGFSVEATPGTPLLYQWLMDGKQIEGATNATLTLTNIQLPNEGSYSVNVVNRFGSTTSASAHLAILLPPRIMTQPQDIQARPGTNVSFKVVADSATALEYQWMKNGVAIPGAQGATLELSQVDLVDQGLYSVRVKDQVDTVFSLSASLLILIDPLIQIDPIGAVTVPGGSATFSVQVTNTATLPITYRWKRGASDIVGGTVTVNERISFITVTNILGTQTNFSVTVSNIARKTAIVSKTASVALLTDTDKDGLPDVWERQFAFDPASATDAGLDWDGDLMSNQAEFIAGTNPKDPASLLSLRGISTGPAGTLLEFDAVENRTYTLEYAESLTAPVWNRLADIVATPGAHKQQVLDPSTGTNRFYRVQTPRRR